MALLSILYGTKRVVINDSSSSTSERGFKGILARSKRNVLQEVGAYAGIVLDCTTLEDHSYRAEVTKNPIEDGAPVSDHVSLEPVVLRVEGLVSDSPIGFALIGTAQNVARKFSSLFGTQSRAKDAFDSIELLWKKRLPFTVITNLKRYDNMVISNAKFPFSSDTGHALDLSIEFTQLSIVKSKIVGGSPQSGFLGLASSLSDKGGRVTQAIPASSTIKNGIQSNKSFLKDLVT